MINTHKLKQITWGEWAVVLLTCPIWAPIFVALTLAYALYAGFVIAAEVAWSMTHGE